MRLKLFAALAALLFAGLAPAGLITQSGPKLFVDADEGGGEESDTLTADIQASRTSCTAPCAVLFNAVGTTHTNGEIDTFREVGYSFNFDDSGSGTYSTSGESKNVQRGGPLAAHVYESAGTYTAKVRACYDEDTDGTCDDGEWSQDSVTVTVTAANTTYSGTNTICISQTTDHTGCPSGATQTSNATSWPTPTNNRRYLLRAGQNFESFGEPPSFGGLQNIQYGKYGSGANPVIEKFTLEGFPPSFTTPSSNLVFSDIDFTDYPNVHANVTDLLFLRCTVDSQISMGDFGSWLGSYADVLFWPKRIFVVESDVSGSTYGVFGGARSPVLLGSNIHDIAGGDGHVVRFGLAYEGVIAHNIIAGSPNDGRHLLKMHGQGTASYTDDLETTTSPATRYVVIANNTFGESGDGQAWAVSISPQSDAHQEGVEDVIVENNEWAVDFGVELTMGGRRITDRGNTSAGDFDYAENTHTAPTGWNGPYYHTTSPPTSDPS
jgi:hypothetical protein